MALQKSILVVEDDAPIRHLLVNILHQENWLIYEADSVQRALIEAASRQPEYIILDLGLKDGDGIDFIKSIRQWSDIPVIVLTARDQEKWKISALDAGANDYMVKPFSIPELLARLRVQMRQRRPQQHESEYVFGHVKVDTEHRLVSVNGENAHLTPIEYKLLLEFIRGENTVFTHRQLLLAIWGPNCVETPQYLRTYVGKLRQKIEDDPETPKHIVTEVGVGYRFCRE